MAREVNLGRWVRMEVREARALTSAGINEYVRPFHDLRHTSITNYAAAGANPVAPKTKAGHSNMSTTQQYIHLAGVVFREEADALETRYLGERESVAA